MARKHVLIASVLAIFIDLCGCGEAVSTQNTISPKELTKDQQEIVDLLSCNTKQ